MALRHVIYAQIDWASHNRTGVKGPADNPKRLTLEFSLSDIFREVEEDVRREKYEKIWDDWGTLIIAFVAIVIGGTAAFQIWQSYQGSQRMAFADQYLAASKLAGSEQQEDAIEAFATLAKSGSQGYQTLSKFRQAGILGDLGRVQEATVLFDEVAADPAVDDAFRRLAEIKAAVLLAETAPYTDLKARVVPLAESQTPWRFSALEILGYAAFKHDDKARAIQSFQRLSDDPETPVSIRTRATEMLIVLGAPKKELLVPPSPAIEPDDVAPDSGVSE